MTLVVNAHIGLSAWSSATYAVGDRRSSGGNAYQCIVPGSSTSAPTGTGAAINNGGAAYWKWLSAIDFSTLATLQASLPGTFTQPIIWSFWNDGTITIPGATAPYLTLSGHVTSPTNTLTVTCAPGESFRDNLAVSSAPGAFSTAAGVSFTLPSATPPSPFNFFQVNDANVIFDGLQFKDPNASSGCTVILTASGATGFVLRNCIIDAAAQTGGADIIDFNDTFAMNNCLFIDRQPVAGGKIPLRVAKAGNIVNCTAIAPNNPASTFFVVSNATTAAANTLRNIAAFGYSGVGQSAIAPANVVIDHCASSSATIGPAGSITNGGSNLVSQSAVATFVSSTTDWRLLISAPCVNAGATDATDIPAATDATGIARPQGSAWDIGAFEFPNLKLRGSTTTRGRGTLAKTVPSRGVAEAAGRGILTVGVAGFSLRGTAMVSGRSSGTFSTAPIADPWAADFSIGFGPLGTTAFSGCGLAKSHGRSAVLAARPISAGGVAESAGLARIGPVSLMTCRGLSHSTGSNSGFFALASAQADSWAVDFSGDFGPLSSTQFTGSRGKISSFGKAVLSLASTGGPAKGAAAAKGRGNPSFALTTSRGTAASRGRVSSTTLPAVMVGKGFSSVYGQGLGLYTAPPSQGGPFGPIFSAQFGGPGIAWGTIRSTGRGSITSPVALSAAGTAISAGNSLASPPDALVLFGRGHGQLTAATSGLVKITTLQTAGNASSKGGGRAGIALPLAATGVSKAKASGAPAYNTVVPIRGVAHSKGQLTTAVLTAPLATSGSSQTKAKLDHLGAFSVAFTAVSPAASSGAAAIIAAKPLVTRGTAQASGQLGNTATQHLAAGGLSTSRGRGVTGFVAALAASGSGDCFGRAAALTSIRSISAYGAGISAGSADLISIATFIGSGLGLSHGSMAGDDAFTAALTVSGVAQTDGTATAQQSAELSVAGSAQSNGTLAAFTGVAQLQALGRAIASGRVAAIGFAPVALTGSGVARSASAARVAGSMTLTGAGVGLSVGRCVTIATTLLQAAGRSHGAGRLVATSSAAVGFMARGRADTRGYLSSVLGLHASGLIVSAGRGQGGSYYSIAPDASGPRLSSLIQMPFFDSIDVGDVDFFSWDWSTRVSALGDPIVSAMVTSAPSGLPIVGTVVVGDIVQTRAGPSAVVETFSLRCTVTLRSGRVLHWSAPLSVADF